MAARVTITIDPENGKRDVMTHTTTLVNGEFEFMDDTHAEAIYEALCEKFASLMLTPKDFALPLGRQDVIDILRAILNTRNVGQASTVSASMMILKFADLLKEEPEAFTHEIVRGLR